MSTVLLDTHAIIWYFLDFRRLSANAFEAIANIPREIVPEMPDRIIAATALYLNIPLVTKDSKIQAANIQTIW